MLLKAFSVMSFNKKNVFWKKDMRQNKNKVSVLQSLSRLLAETVVCFHALLHIFYEIKAALTFSFNQEEYLGIIQNAVYILDDVPVMIIK